MRQFLPAALFLLLFSFSVPAQEFSITIDAQKDAFYESLTGPENGYVYLPMRSYLTDIGFAPDDDTDLSGSVWFSWDETYLYCYAEVTDDIVSAASVDRFQNDCVELKFDPDPGAGAGNATSNSRITGIGYDMDFDSVGIDNLNGSGHLEDAGGDNWIVSESDYARRLTDNGYVVEFRIPFEFINEMEDDRFMIARSEGEVFGLAINFGDNDSGTRDHVVQWSAAHADSVHSRPIGLGSATFMANHILKLEAVSPRDPSVVNDSAEVWYTPNAVGVEQEQVIKSFHLSQNYPNPFNPSTKINFSINERGNVRLSVYNLLGQEIKTLVNEEKAAGNYEISFDASEFSSGLYFYKLTAGVNTITKSMSLIK